MKAYLDTEYYAYIDLDNMEFTVKKFEGEKAIGMSPLNENMTLKELREYIEMQKGFLKE